MTETATKPLMTAVDYLKQWMLDPNHQHHRPLRPKTPFSGPDDHTHSLLNQRTRTFLRRQQTSGVRLGGTATTVTRWFFTRASEDHSPLRYGEPLAMGYGTNPAYLHYQRHSVGADLAWSDQPRFEWELLGRVSGQPARLRRLVGPVQPRTRRLPDLLRPRDRRRHRLAQQRDLVGSAPGHRSSGPFNSTGTKP